jgi:uncharacterized protein
LDRPSSTQLRQLIGHNKVVVIDEAQRIANIGITSKLIIDELPDVQLILTGSSAYKLSNEINEPLTGRKFEFQLFPFSFAELSEYTSVLLEKRLLEHRIIYGHYPEIVNNPSEEKDRLLELISSYLFKDIFALGEIKKPNIIDRLTKALALQIGSEVSYNELSQSIGVDKGTISRYIDLLEKTHVIFSLHSFSRNQRNELKKSRKIYFRDTGIRNAVIKNFNPLELRTDKGALWENFIISERLKYLNNTGKKPNFYFWRTFQKQEIDYIEENADQLSAFEIKWNPKSMVKQNIPFLNGYPDSKFKTINVDNFIDFIT